MENNLPSWIQRLQLFEYTLGVQQSSVEQHDPVSLLYCLVIECLLMHKHTTFLQHRHAQIQRYWYNTRKRESL